MFRVISRIASAAAVSVALLALTPASGMALLGSAPSVTLQVVSQAQLQPNGSALVTIDYTCLPGFGTPTGTIVLDVEQPQAAGFAFGEAVCDDTKHFITLDAAPGPFTRGSASVLASFFSSNATATAQAEITIQ